MPLDLGGHATTHIELESLQRGDENWRPMEDFSGLRPISARLALFAQPIFVETFVTQVSCEEDVHRILLLLRQT